ncbi:hypothetical protein, partial [Bilophila wadsworthia]|uniref:hypothetical protein n=1 Tax=Bilophila wadsworthia TaxID=35833 RepID=UPI001EDB8ECE
YILGDVFHQDDTSPTELLGEADDEDSLSGRISSLMNQSFPPKHIFVIEGVKYKVSISGVSIKS